MTRLLDEGRPTMSDHRHQQYNLHSNRYTYSSSSCSDSDTSLQDMSIDILWLVLWETYILPRFAGVLTLVRMAALPLFFLFDSECKSTLNQKHELTAGTGSLEIRWGRSFGPWTACKTQINKQAICWSNEIMGRTESTECEAHLDRQSGLKQCLHCPGMWEACHSPKWRSYNQKR